MAKRIVLLASVLFAFSLVGRTSLSNSGASPALASSSMTSAPTASSVGPSSSKTPATSADA
ncbi:MAG: hypothetical protein WCS90_03980 [Bacilli bacterium]